LPQAVRIFRAELFSCGLLSSTKSRSGFRFPLLAPKERVLYAPFSFGVNNGREHPPQAVRDFRAELFSYGLLSSTKSRSGFRFPLLAAKRLILRKYISLLTERRDYGTMMSATPRAAKRHRDLSDTHYPSDFAAALCALYAPFSGIFGLPLRGCVADAGSDTGGIALLRRIKDCR